MRKPHLVDLIVLEFICPPGQMAKVVVYALLVMYLDNSSAQ
jgi:hypothetical protein